VCALTAASLEESGFISRVEQRSTRDSNGVALCNVELVFKGIVESDLRRELGASEMAEHICEERHAIKRLDSGAVCIDRI